MIDLKAVASLHRRFQLFHVPHVGPHGPAPQVPRELVELRRRADGVHLDAPVVQVACVPRHASPPSAVLRVTAIPHALHTTANEVTARDVFLPGAWHTSTISPMARALYVAFDVFPRAKGSTSHIASMVACLQRVFGGVTLLCLGTAEMPAFQREGAIEIYRFRERRRLLLRRATDFARFVAGHTRRLRGELALAVFRDPWGGYPLLRAAPGCPSIFEVNALPSWELEYSRPALRDNAALRAKLQDIERRCLREASRVLCVSSVTRRALGVDATVIPNLAHDVFFRAAARPAGQRCGYIGGLQPWQGIEQAIDSVIA